MQGGRRVECFKKVKSNFGHPFGSYRQFSMAPFIGQGLYRLDYIQLYQLVNS
jgi:hypothetical protein